MFGYEELSLNWRSAIMFSVCLPMLVIAIMLLSRTVERRANAFLGLLLVAVVLVQVPQIIGFAGAYDLWPELTFMPFNTELYFGSLLFLHAWSLTNSAPIGKRWLLLLPGLIYQLYFIGLVLAFPNYLDRWEFNDRFHQPFVLPVVTVLVPLSVVISLAAIYRLTKKYQQFLYATQSIADRFNPIWLIRMMSIGAFVGAILVVFQSVELVWGRLSYFDAFPFQLIIAAVIAWLSLQALAHTTIEFPKIYDFSSEPIAESNSRDWQKEGRELMATIKHHQWYLDPSITLSELSAKMASNESYISKSINSGLGMNFNRLFNSLRTEHAKSLFKDSSISILEIANLSGFNSKATFNRVFKEITSETPSQYRKKFSSRM